MMAPICARCALEQMCHRADLLRDQLLAVVEGIESAGTVATETAADVASYADTLASELRRLDTLLADSRSLAGTLTLEACGHVAPLSAADAAVALSVAMYGDA